MAMYGIFSFWLFYMVIVGKYTKTYMDPTPRKMNGWNPRVFTPGKGTSSSKAHQFQVRAVNLRGGLYGIVLPWPNIQKNQLVLPLGDTIAWTLGRIAQFHPSIVPVKQLMPLLCEKLRDVPRVSANICWNVQVEIG